MSSSLNKTEEQQSTSDDEVIDMMICNKESSAVDCGYLKNLCAILNQYQSSRFDISTSRSETLTALNCFLHLLDKHDNDDAFEAIVHTVHCCDIVSCRAYRRNTRDRTLSFFFFS
eukprot:314204_1